MISIEREVGDRLPIGEARAFVEACLALGQLGLELVQQAALAQAGLAHDRDDLALSLLRPVPRRYQRVEFGLAADEARQATLRQDFEAAERLVGGDGLIGGNGFGLTLQRQGTDHLPVEGIARRPVGRLPGQDPARRGG